MPFALIGKMMAKGIKIMDENFLSTPADASEMSISLGHVKNRET